MTDLEVPQLTFRNHIPFAWADRTKEVSLARGLASGAHY